MDNSLEVSGLSKKFKDFSLKEISFVLPRGYIMGFIGPNGAGKSTTIKLIMNLLKKDSGKIKILGLDHHRDEIDVKNRIGIVYDENHFHEELTISEMIRVISPFYKKWDDVQFKKYIKEFDLPLKTKLKKLSKGMKMKFSLAVALSHHAELLIMDEPTAGLDPLIRSELLEILSDLIQDEKKAVFFSTHITSDLDKIADYITFINHGEIIFSDSKENLLDCYGLVRGSRELLDHHLKKLFIGIKESQFGFEGLIKDRQKLSSDLKQTLVIEKPTLEDIMLYTAKGQK